MTALMPQVACMLIACAPSPDTVDRACVCAAGTERFRTRTSAAARASEAYYPQAEEYCRKKKDGQWVRHGHYILWGPNGERLQEGEYREGKREGAWKYWSPNQLATRWFAQGSRESVAVAGAPQEFIIDFCACNRQWMDVAWALGSRYWRILGTDGPDCIVEIGGEIEMAELPSRFFLVPRDLGRLTFKKDPRLGWHGELDFSPLAPYVVPDSTHAVRRARARSRLH